MYLHYNQIGYKKVNCPSLAGATGRTPAPATLRIINSHPVKIEAPMVKTQAFEFKIKEERAIPYMVFGMYFLLYFLLLSIIVFTMMFTIRYVLSQFYANSCSI